MRSVGFSPLALANGGRRDGADLPDLDGWKAYLAGPPAMVDAAAPLLLERGIRKDDIHADVFFTPERQAA